MMAITNVKMDLLGGDGTPTLHAVQGDTGTRAVELELYVGEEAWAIPKGVSAMARYSKNDGTGGVYDSLSDGTTAFTVLDNMIRLVLAPEILATPGMAEIQVTLYQQQRELTTFSLYLHIHEMAGLEGEAPADYVNLAQWLQSALEHMEADGILGPQEVVVPKYVRTAADLVAGHVLEVTGQADADSRVPFTLAFLTDLHWSADNEERLRAAATALSVISETAAPDAVVFGGDYIGQAGLSAKEAGAAIGQCRRIFARVPGAIWLRGSGDGNADHRLTRAQVFQYISRAQQTLPGYVSNPADPFGCYGYMDFENSRIRLVCVNTADHDEMGLPADGSLENYPNISAAQLQWMADCALDFSAKADPAAWGLVFVSHAPIYTGEANYGTFTDEAGLSWMWNAENLEHMVKAYTAKTSFITAINGQGVSKDFSSVTPAQVLCFVNGGHTLNNRYHYGFTHVTCPNAGSGGETVAADGNTYAKGDVGTATETAFTVLTVEPASGKVCAWTYGAGYHQVIL